MSLVSKVAACDIPAWHAVGMRRVHLGSGEWVQEMDSQLGLLDQDGRLAPGALAVLADSALGYAAARAAPPGLGMVTTHLHLELPGPVPRELTTVRCSALSRSLGSTSGFAHGDVTDQDGVVLAHTTMRSFYIQPRRPPPTRAMNGHPRTSTEPDPSLVEGVPVLESIGTRVIEVGDGRAHILVESSPRFANTSTGLHGGFGALMGERALDLALRSVLGPTRAMALVELRIAYLRMVPASGQLIECRADVIHLGRSLAATRAEVLAPDGRVAVTVDAMHAPV